MKHRFRIEFLEEVFDFLDALDEKTQKKEIDKATELMKKHFKNKKKNK